MGVTDNTWHHLCVLWKIRDDEVEVFKDGERKYVSTGFQSISRRIGIEGTVKHSFILATQKGENFFEKMSRYTEFTHLPGRVAMFLAAYVHENGCYALAGCVFALSKIIICQNYQLLLFS